jgi:dTDP-4-amino-4,6-dideoxygalactose transaminase
MKRRVPVGDFKIDEEEKKAISDVMEGGRISEWKKVKEFEDIFANYIGTKYCIAVSSGTSALLIGLLALLYDGRFPKVQKGAKVIASPVTYVSTVNAIILAGFEPVFIDIDKRTFTLNTEQLEEVISKEPESFAGIIPVHLMGYPNDMNEINRIAEQYSLFVLEDSAQAHGTIYNGKKAGSLGLLSSFSFYIAHNIQAGEMGCVTTDDRKLYQLMKQLKSNGRLCSCEICTRNTGQCPGSSKYDDIGDYDPRFTFEYVSYNFKTTEFPAALAVSQVKQADSIFLKRLSNVKYLNEHLEQFSELFYLPVFSEDISYLAYPIMLTEGCAFSRKWIRKELENRGIENRPLFGCLPTQQPVFAHMRAEYRSKLPNANYVGENAFYIGCHQYLEKADLDYIVKMFEAILTKGI